MPTSISRKTGQARIAAFGPLPTPRQEFVAIAICGLAMCLISASLAYFGLI
jgi:hypothetical protein